MRERTVYTQVVQHIKPMRHDAEERERDKLAIVFSELVVIEPQSCTIGVQLRNSYPMAPKSSSPNARSSSSLPRTATASPPNTPSGQ